MQQAADQHPGDNADHRAQQRAEKAPDVGGDRLSVPVELIVIGHADELGSFDGGDADKRGIFLGGQAVRPGQG